MYVNRLTRVIDPLGPFSTNMDVEELVEYGKKERVCPYYVAREAAEHAEIIMCPYNYIIEPCKQHLNARKHCSRPSASSDSRRHGH